MDLYSGGGKRLARGRGGRRLRRRGIICLIPAVLLLSCAALTAVILPWRSGAADPPPEAAGEVFPVQETVSPSEGEGTDPAPQPDRADGEFLLSFAGDCTLGVEHDSWGNSGTFPAVVGTDYAYPLSGVRDLFTADDFTFVNLECALTDHTTPAEKEYRFRGPPAYGQILKEGGVDAVSLANNHSLDYGTAGLQETRQVLSDLSIAAGGDKEALLYTTDRGLKIGVYTAYHIGKAEVRQAIESLRQQGAQVIIAAFHMGTEGSYTPTAWQREICRYAAECGAQIVYNSHPHVLQPMERWGESVILYSMGNFCFGGNRNPSDKDTAVVQVSVQVQADGTAELGEVTVIPCSVSSRSDRNDYRPTPCGSDSAQAARVRSKLDGTFRPPAPAPAAETVPVSGSAPATAPAQ